MVSSFIMHGMPSTHYVTKIYLLTFKGDGEGGPWSNEVYRWVLHIYTIKVHSYKLSRYLHKSFLIYYSVSLETMESLS